MTTIRETPGVQGGYPCVNDTRIPVRSIVESRRCYADDDAGFYAYTDGIGLTRDDVVYTFSWYVAHPERVDEDIERQRVAGERLRLTQEMLQ